MNALKLKDLIQYLNELLPGVGINDFAPNGLQVEGKETIKSIGTAVTASLATIEAAIEQNVEALIVHHGLFWQRDSYVIEGIKKEKLSLLLQNGISLFSYHLPLDLHPDIGNNWKAARDLGWMQLQPFGSFNGIPIGVKGIVSPCSCVELKERLENYYHHTATCAWGGPKVIQSVALISGGAYKSIREAAQEGVDAFITGSFDEPAWYQAFEEKVNFYALGHSATERIGPMALAQHLEKKFQMSCQFLDIENPF